MAEKLEFMRDKLGEEQRWGDHGCGHSLGRVVRRNLTNSSSADRFALLVTCGALPASPQDFASSEKVRPYLTRYKR